MIKPIHGLPPETVLSAFPFHIVLAQSLEIVQMGSVIERLSPHALGHFFGNHFQLIRPKIDISLEGITAHAESVFVLELASSAMRLKGQMLPVADSNTIIFLGSPWITDLSEIESLGIHLNDFAIHDSVSDYLLLLQSKNTALNDTKKLAEKLTEKQKKLRASNHELRQEIVERTRIEAELAAARDQAIEASQIKSQFLATMSHEIRTPMNGIMGMGQLLLDTSLTREQSEFAKIIYAEAEHLLGLINEILDFSKIEAGKLNLEIIDFSLTELVVEVTRLLQPKALDKHLNLSILINPGVPERVFGDSTRCRQVLVNLVSNAIKFTSEGVVQIRLRLAPEWPGGRTQSAYTEQIPVEIVVQDSGIGIQEEQIAQLFDSFTQADNSTTRRFGGTGLGLAICKNLVELMQGTISVSSQPSIGSTFSVVIPFGIVKEVAGEHKIPIAEHRQLETHAILPQNMGFPMILIAEDQKVNQMVINSALKKMGYGTLLAENGEQAVQAYKAQPDAFAAIIMDWRMPEMDGLQATQLIRQIEADSGSHIPIIGMTANAMKGDKERCLAAGMDDYLSKPVRFDELKIVLRRWTRDSQNRSDAPDLERKQLT